MLKYKNYCKESCKTTNTNFKNKNKKKKKTFIRYYEVIFVKKVKIIR